MKARGKSRRYEAREPIKSWPTSDRPKDRLARRGARHLSDSELLSIVIGSGARGRNAVDVARSILNRFGSLSAIESVQIDQLREVEGVGLAKALSIKSALELGRRFIGADSQVKPEPFKTSADVAAYLMPTMKNFKREVFKVVLLDIKNSSIGSITISEGGLNAALIRPADIFAPAIARSAVGLILAHNHPSGDPTPSEQDINLTKMIARTGEMVDVKVVDHLIFADRKWYSFSDEGVI